MHTNSRRQYFIITLLLSLAIAITIHFPMIMSYIFGGEEVKHGGRMTINLTGIGSELLITFVLAFLMFSLNFFILKPVEAHRKLNILNISLAII